MTGSRAEAVPRTADRLRASVLQTSAVGAPAVEATAGASCYEDVIEVSGKKFAGGYYRCRAPEQEFVDHYTMSFSPGTEIHGADLDFAKDSSGNTHRHASGIFIEGHSKGSLALKTTITCCAFR